MRDRTSWMNIDCALLLQTNEQAKPRLADQKPSGFVLEVTLVPVRVQCEQFSQRSRVKRLSQGRAHIWVLCASLFGILGLCVRM